jgi:hypothetical protein
MGQLFQLVSRLRNFSRRCPGSGPIVLLTGSARGTYAVGGNLPTENHWEVPSAWKAVVRNAQIAEWHVYADNQPVRKIMGQINP